MGLRDKLRTRAVEVIKEPQIGPPAVVGEDISLFEAAYGKQRPTRRDSVVILTGAEAEAQVGSLSEAQKAGYAVQMELARRREVGRE
ncbi:hypothetical protein [Conexibacter arvalis]|uniref:Uncharacterized protein n=1 Tax=Conexibacter arvalis TaxID=912552 RepID=A0A840IDZ5_9ACTN|nr:hypothetical protein [Conexibacter arvalis]MBB4663016.1 hypothetical protein [Conexibacter arvalis]